jgi:hypothetical protein
MGECLYRSTVLDLGTRWNEWSASRPGRFTRWIGGCMCTRGGIDTMEERKIRCPAERCIRVLQTIARLWEVAQNSGSTSTKPLAETQYMGGEDPKGGQTVKRGTSRNPRPEFHIHWPTDHQWTATEFHLAHLHLQGQSDINLTYRMHSNLCYFYLCRNKHVICMAHSLYYYNFKSHGRCEYWINLTLIPFWYS